MKDEHKEHAIPKSSDFPHKFRTAPVFNHKKDPKDQ